mmetsp:Transcript_13573/g.28663  ORF Transcript_13573/g.28663 Transcript_13573/m.28663 type:complete len:279 (-) Transcript_13573:109-945(-)
MMETFFILPLRLLPENLESSLHARVNRLLRCSGRELLSLLGEKLLLKGSVGGSSLSSLLSLKDTLGRRLLLRLKNSDNIIKRNLGSNDSLRILGKHDGNLNSNNSLPHKNVTDSNIGVDLSSMSRLDHVTISEFHGLGTLPSQLSGYNDLASLSRSLHNETNNSVTGTTHGESGKKLEFKRLGLGLGTKPTVLDTLGIKLHGTISEVKPLLNDGGQFANALSFLSEYVLGFGGADDDLGTVGGGADLDTGVSVLGELAGEEFVQLGVEDSIRNKLAFG